jgi:hypothetical protein
MKPKVLILLSVLFIPGYMLNAQISPGDLAEVHKHLEGMANCTQCHILGEKVSNEKCLDCHKEIKERIDNQKGYHFSDEVRDKACAECHNDHHGRKFEIIRFDKTAFNHDLTGYELFGTHKKKQCEDCHKSAFINDEKIKSKTFTYLGLGTNCLNCHEDYHQNTLSVSCTDCHGYEQFGLIENFDHNKARFVLRGKHVEVDCIKCHKISERNGKKFQEFTGLQFNNCTACHKDVHENQFGPDCSKCHTEQSFHVIKDLNVFNHDLTNFKLEGKHMNVACKTCHKTNYTDPLKHDRCFNCHDDYHKGEFDRQGVKTDCSSCHNVNGFDEFTFTIEQHNKGAFALAGAHLATPCFACHLNPSEERWKFREIGINCADCHEDIHRDIIDTKYYPNLDCKRCHDVNVWNEVVFDHGLTKFALEGAHLNQSCRSCHFRENEPGNITQVFTNLSSACTNCHSDNHYGQFESDGITDCKKCHTFNNWKLENFDHSITRFPLDGKHENVACAACHKKTETDGIVYIKYKFEDIRCEACHQ